MTLAPELREQIDTDITLLKQRMREYYRETKWIFENYEDSYRQFIEGDNPQPFKLFLGAARQQYLSLAAYLSANAHAVNLIEDQIRRGGPQVYAVHHRELLDCLLKLYDISPLDVLSAASA